LSGGAGLGINLVRVSTPPATLPPATRPTVLSLLPPPPLGINLIQVRPSVPRRARPRSALRPGWLHAHLLAFQATRVA